MIFERITELIAIIGISSVIFFYKLTEESLDMHAMQKETLETG